MGKVCVMGYTLLIMIFLAQVSRAQPQENRDLRFGMKGGQNFATMHGSVDTGFEGITGIHAGVFMNFRIFENRMSNLKFQLEANYIEKGTVIKGHRINEELFANIDLFTDEEMYGYAYAGDNIFDEDIRSLAQIGFIEFPLLLKYGLPLGRFSVYAFAGPSFNILLNFSMDYHFQLTTEEGVIYKQNDIDPHWESYWTVGDVSALTGLGIGLPFGIFAEVRYESGLRNALNTNRSRINYRGLVANMGVQF